MPAPPRLLTALRAELVAHDVVRIPHVAGALPPMWLAPDLGTPAPGEGINPVEIDDDLVLAAYVTGGFTPPSYGSWARKPIVDVRIRTAPEKSYLAEDIELAISKVLIDHFDWTMGGLHVLESQQWRALQRLGSDTQGAEHVTAYWFELLRA